MTMQEAPVCPRCGRKDIRFRASDGTMWCRQCGYDSRRDAEPGEGESA